MNILPSRLAPRESFSREVAREGHLTSQERKRVALASLALMEREHELRIAQIRAERRALLARSQR